MQDRYNLDVDTAASVPIVLDTVATFYRESAAELSADWQEKSAGEIWNDFARILDNAADSCHRAIQRRGLA